MILGGAMIIGGAVYFSVVISDPKLSHQLRAWSFWSLYPFLQRPYSNYPIRHGREEA